MSSLEIQYPVINASLDIRLLRILPGQRNDPIACTLSAVQRDAKPRYGAVSYTWGDIDHIETIFVNGRPVLVRHNCFFALWQMRLHAFNLPLWIDSICINQSNNEEKSKQVRLMGSIYKNAEITTACIGEGLGLHDVVKDMESCDYDDNIDFDELDADQQRRTISLQERYAFLRRRYTPWHDLEPFFLQVAASTSKAAQDEVDTGELQDLDTTLLARFIHFRKFRLAQLALKTEWTDEITGHGFTGVLLSFGEGACADPRDKIYGLLSLAQDSSWIFHFPVDYKRPLIDVLRDVVSRVGRESLTENTSRLIANMLRWFSITADSNAGQELLQSTQHNVTRPWRDFSQNFIPFDSVRVWRIVNVPMSHITIDFVPHTKNLLMYFNDFAVHAKASTHRLNWHRVCQARGRLIKSRSEDCWIAGPEAKPGDFIVEFHAMRDEKDEHSTMVVCRPPYNRKLTRMDIVDQASILVSLEDYDKIHGTEFRRSYASEGLAELETRYLTSRMLFAWPSKVQFEVRLKPLDLINAVMARGDVINRIRNPILSRNSGCYADRIEVDEAELLSRTFTITIERPPLPPGVEEVGDRGV